MFPFLLFFSTNRHTNTLTWMLFLVSKFVWSNAYPFWVGGRIGFRGICSWFMKNISAQPTSFDLHVDSDERNKSWRKWQSKCNLQTLVLLHPFCVFYESFTSFVGAYCHNITARFKYNATIGLKTVTVKIQSHLWNRWKTGITSCFLLPFTLTNKCDWTLQRRSNRPFQKYISKQIHEPECVHSSAPSLNITLKNVQWFL